MESDFWSVSGLLRGPSVFATQLRNSPIGITRGVRQPRPSREPQMQRSQFTIRRVMLVVIGCALIFTILRIDEGRSPTAILCYTAGPVFGAVVQRCRVGVAFSVG